MKNKYKYEQRRNAVLVDMAMNPRAAKSLGKCVFGGGSFLLSESLGCALPYGMFLSSSVGVLFLKLFSHWFLQIYKLHVWKETKLKRYIY